MIAALVLTLAAAAVSGVVHDSTGAVVVGASVIVRPAAGPERQTLTGPDGRFTVESPEDGDVTLDRPGRWLCREDRARLPAPIGTLISKFVLAPATLLETVTVTPTRTEQRLGDMPASVNVLTSEADRGVAGASSPTTCCARFRPSASSAAPAASPPSRRRRACRFAGSDRAARAARSSCSTAFRSTIPSAAGSTGRACRSSAWIGSRSPRARRRACTATTPWAASSTSSRAGRRAGRSRSSRSTATTTARRSTSSPATGGTRSGAAVEGSFLNTDGFPIVAPIERGPIDNNANVNYKNVTGKLEFTPSDRFNAFFRAGLLHREPGQRARSAKSTTRGGRRRAAACGCGCRTRAISRRACSSTCRRRTSTSWP